MRNTTENPGTAQSTWTNLLGDVCLIVVFVVEINGLLTGSGR